ncbi:sulfotransferase [Caulobacter sp. S45]|uniref:tetratricopeptide repeat-containing sulfotransferase family protein n=1 Tax=Caulobacter sp. S45 TaxID=1641861 RepID=UPI0015760DE7|nr:sulfotransferase [Caulobacter sp. S45]
MTEQRLYGGAAEAAAEPAAPPAKVLAALQRGDGEAAARLAEQALAAGVVHPMLYGLRARRAEGQGRLLHALEDFSAAVRLAPQNAELQQAQGALLVRLGRGREAMAAFRRALALRPDLGGVWHELGMAQIGDGDVSGARTSLTQAAERLPGRPEPLGQLSVLATRRGDWEEGRRLALAALALDPAMASATRALAEADLQAGRPDEAAERLEVWLAHGTGPGPARRLALGLLGDVRERQGRHAEAFALYAQGNAETRRLHEPRFGRSKLVETLQGLRTQTLSARPEPWRLPLVGEPPPPPRVHVFLMGFMRSGTTLLEQALAARDDVVTLEEREALTSGVQAFLGEPNGLERLRHADLSTLSRHRADYWARVRGFGVEPAGKVFVDKNPFNGVKLPLLWRLFPEAKIVFSLRQPQDVVLSCFKHRFAVNSYTYELLDLQSAARLYDSYMRLVQTYLDVIPGDVLLYRHEDLVADLPGALARICDHLGLELSAEMFDVGRRVREGRVSSPSAVQLRNGVNRQGLQTWRRYATHLQGVQPLLEPWSRTFGYVEGGGGAPSFKRAATAAGCASDRDGA